MESPRPPGLMAGDQRSSVRPWPRSQGRVQRYLCRWPMGEPCLVSGRCLQGRDVFTCLFTCLYPFLCCRNAEKILGYLHSNVLSRDLIPPHVNFSHLTAKDYTEMYKVIMAVKEDRFSALGLDPCLLEDELDKV